MPANTLSWSSVGVGPSRTMPAFSAAATYLRTVSRDRPVPSAMLRWLFPACQRRTTSSISTVDASLKAIAAPHNEVPLWSNIWRSEWPNDPDYLA